LLFLVVSGGWWLLSGCFWLSVRQSVSRSVGSVTKQENIVIVPSNIK
jgi:hypothetical protein